MLRLVIVSYDDCYLIKKKKAVLGKRYANIQYESVISPLVTRCEDVHIMSYKAR